MDYRRYGLGFYGRNLWVECTECEPPKPANGYPMEERFYVFQWRSGGGFNVAPMIGAIMHHEMTHHPTKLAQR